MMACSPVCVVQVECSFSTQMSSSEGVAALLECVTVLVLCLFEGPISPCLHWPLFTATLLHFWQKIHFIISSQPI